MGVPMSPNDRSRRAFLKTVGAGALAAPWLLSSCRDDDDAPPPPELPDKPNILWISAEDISPDLGCYGDAYATTPNIDAFAAESVRFDAAFANAGVCAPARSCIITGTYPSSIGTNNMRCTGVRPGDVTCFTKYLRDAGYYCTNNSKTDYNFGVPADAWDESSTGAHYDNRPAGDPFFAVFNYVSTHESQIRASYTTTTHDPAAADIPPYYPDTALVRQDWARYYDLLTTLDNQVQSRLDELEAAGLADDTIVWFWGDHGRGLPRAKRWIYDSGLRVPLLIRVPEKYREYVGNRGALQAEPGSACSRLVSFVDFAPTVLAMAGVDIPAHVQGLPFCTPRYVARSYVHGARDRMDEAYDLIRCARDTRYNYIRNYMHHVPQSQDIDYMNQMPTMQEWRRVHDEGGLVFPQTTYFEPTKPVEELYDTETDPHETVNLAGDSQYAATLARMRAALDAWLVDVGDIGLIPEPEFESVIRPGGTADPTWKETLDGTDLLARLRAVKAYDGEGASAISSYTAALSDPDAPVRYWAVVGSHVACTDQADKDAVMPGLKVALEDASPVVRVAAAHALWDWGDEAHGKPVLQTELSASSKFVRHFAITALYLLGDKAQPLKTDIEAAQSDSYNYVQRVAGNILAYLV